jgi:hypothetical protein
LPASQKSYKFKLCRLNALRMANGRSAVEQLAISINLSVASLKENGINTQAFGGAISAFAERHLTVLLHFQNLEAQISLH